VRFVVYGAGAIGGVVGARLVQAGYDVALIARGAHYEAIRDRGLRIQSPIDDEMLQIPVVDHPSHLTLTSDDVVFLAMKSQDTIGACEALDACVPPGVAVACFQNGVENERVVLRHYADTYAVCVMCPASHIDPGVVVAQSAPVSGLLDIGRYPAGLDERAEAIAAALNASTFHSVPRPDVMRWKYTKLLMNLANSIEATVAPDPDVRELARLVRAEGEACLRAAGIDFASRDEDKERRADRMHVQPVNGQMRSGGSSWQSLVRGTHSIEVDYLNGEIVTLGRLHDVPTPANALMQRVANAQARIGAPPQSVPVAQLLAELGA
jgi:2-dehydropantoate 2-reductase